MTRAAIGLGSNVGDRLGHLAAGLEAVAAAGTLVAVSSVYETEPVGGPPQGRFLNAVAVVDTELPPRALLARLQEAEAARGRARGARHGPRSLDLDLLLHGDSVVDEPGLVVPHPRLVERRFVLEPLLEAWPDVSLPDGTPLAGVLAETPPGGVRRLSVPAPVASAAVAETMRIVVVGPGRAGSALALAAGRAGHDVVAIAGRHPERTASAAALVDAAAVGLTDPFPPSDLVVLAVRDDAVAEVAGTIATAVGEATPVVHLSGALPVTTLDVLRPRPVGSFHPLQTLPDAERGARRLAGAWVGVTTDDPALRRLLHALARSLDCRPFGLPDAAKPLYHAAASAAANFLLVALALSEDLFAAVGVPREAARPLVEAAVANAFEMGASSSLTGPVARGDVGTVRRQLDAVAAATPDRLATFRRLVAETAALAGREGFLERAEER